MANGVLVARDAASKGLVEIPDIVARYAAGESLQQIAPDYQVSVRTLYRWLLGGLGDQQYHDLVTQCLVDRVAEADVKLETAPDACHIARAREMARFARMDLERRRPKLYGVQRDVVAAPQVAIQINLRRASATVEIPGNSQALDLQGEGQATLHNDDSKP